MLLKLFLIFLWCGILTAAERSDDPVPPPIYDEYDVEYDIDDSPDPNLGKNFEIIYPKIEVPAAMFDNTYPRVQQRHSQDAMIRSYKVDEYMKLLYAQQFFAEGVSAEMSPVEYNVIFNICDLNLREDVEDKPYVGILEIWFRTRSNPSSFTLRMGQRKFTITGATLYKAVDKTELYIFDKQEIVTNETSRTVTFSMRKEDLKLHQNLRYFLKITYTTDIQEFYRFDEIVNGTLHQYFVALFRFDFVHDHLLFPIYEDGLISAELSTNYQIKPTVSILVHSLWPDMRVLSDFDCVFSQRFGNKINFSSFRIDDIREIGFIVTNLPAHENDKHTIFMRHGAMHERGIAELQKTQNKTAQLLQNWFDISFNGSVAIMTPSAAPLPTNFMRIKVYREEDILYKLNDADNSIPVNMNNYLHIAESYVKHYIDAINPAKNPEDMWLISGLANWMKYHIASTFSNEDFNYLKIDALFKGLHEASLVHSHALNEFVEEPDVIVKVKGSTVFSMMEAVMSKDSLLRAVKDYLQTSRELNATTLGKYIGNRGGGIQYHYSQMLKFWAMYRGYPVLTVSRNGTGREVVIRQDKFYNHKPAPGKLEPSPQFWRVPLHLTLKPTAGKILPEPNWFWHIHVTMEYVFNSPNSAKSYMEINRANGFLRMNYDKNLWDAIVEYMKNSSYYGVNDQHRARIFNDAFALAFSGYISYEIPLKLSTALIDERDYLPWSAVNEHMTTLYRLFDGKNVYQRLLGNYMQKQIDRIFRSPPDGTQLLARIAYDWTCSTIPNRCSVYKSRYFLDLMNPNMTNIIRLEREAAGCNFIRYGSDDDFQHVYDRIKTMNAEAKYFDAYRGLLVRCLSCTKNVTRIAGILDDLLNTNIFSEGETRTLPKLLLENGGLRATDHVLDVAWDLLKYSHGHENFTETRYAKVIQGNLTILETVMLPPSLNAAFNSFKAQLMAYKVLKGRRLGARKQHMIDMVGKDFGKYVYNRETFTKYAEYLALMVEKDMIEEKDVVRRMELPKSYIAWIEKYEIEDNLMVFDEGLRIP